MASDCFLSRDRAGEKPYYYRWQPGRFDFASELVGLRTSGALDLQALNHYLAYGYVPDDLCLAAGVKKLPAAYAGLFDLERSDFRTMRYWQLPEPVADNALAITGEQLAEQAWSLLDDSVRLRLRSDESSDVSSPAGWIPV